MTDLPVTIRLEDSNRFKRISQRLLRTSTLLPGRILNSINPSTNTVFFILSTGRAGSAFLSHILSLAPNATVEHQPAPGLETVNYIGLDRYLNSRDDFLNISLSVQNHMGILNDDDHRAAASVGGLNLNGSNFGRYFDFVRQWHPDFCFESQRHLGRRLCPSRIGQAKDDRDRQG